MSSKHFCESNGGRNVPCVHKMLISLEYFCFEGIIIANETRKNSPALIKILKTQKYKQN